MSFLKQYRANLFLLSALGLAPFIGFYTKPHTVRVYVPIIAYNLILVVMLPIFAGSYLNKLVEMYISNQHRVSVLLLAEYTYFLILLLLYIFVLFASIFVASLQAEFLRSLDTFHEEVCALSPKKQSVWIIFRLMTESNVCNLICCGSLFHMELQAGILLDSFVISFLLFVIMAFMCHIRSIICLLRNDIRTIRYLLSNTSSTSKTGLIHDDPAFLLLDKFVKIKQSFESTFGPTLACCAVFDFVILVVVVYMFAMYFYQVEFSWMTFTEGILGYPIPFLIRNVLLARNCIEIANEVGGNI